MITFETLQECKDSNDLIHYVLHTQFNDFVDFIIENGCSALTEVELDEFEELDEMIYVEGVEDPHFVKAFEELVDKAANDVDTRHIYALAVRLYASIDAPDDFQADLAETNGQAQQES